MKLGTCLYLGTFYSFSLLFCSLKAHISLILERRLRFSCDQADTNIKRSAERGRWGRGSSPPAGGGAGGLPREFFGKLPQNDAFWCILEQLLQISKPKIYIKKIASLYVKTSY